MGIDCATFLIEKDNVVRRTRRKVKVAKHVAEAEEALNALYVVLPDHEHHVRGLEDGPDYFVGAQP
ncbi:hypothetical protein [Reyranella sp.]|uniref:hypothetical protein n=1 Tax=Reyranella sp. TaxID=1929291 RepID=UPI003D0D3083